MALTLPYPDLVFVPLDILTAEEQNEIVANYTYIANQFPIASSNIDSSTFELESSYNFRKTFSTITDIATYTVQRSGIFLISCNVRCQQDSGSPNYYGMNIKRGSSVLSNISHTADEYWRALSSTIAVNCNVGDIINITVDAAGGSSTVSGGYSIVRIA